MADLPGIASVITAAAVLVTAIGTLPIVRRTHEMVKQVDAAVNGKPPGSTTMVSQVQDMHDKTFPEPQPINGAAILPTLKRMEELLKQLTESSN